MPDRVLVKLSFPKYSRRAPVSFTSTRRTVDSDIVALAQEFYLQHIQTDVDGRARYYLVNGIRRARP